MKTKKIENLDNSPINKGARTINCCGGLPENDKGACCRLDEDSKAAGESGCNCISSATNKSGSGCC